MSEESKDLTSRDLQHVANALGVSSAIAAITGGPATAGVLGGLAAASAAIGTVFEKRVDDRRHTRQQLLIQNIEKRLADVEKRDPDDAEVDLFAEMFLRAVADDDSRKIPFHAAFIAWMVKAKRKPAEARVLGDAIVRLTYEELMAFSAWGTGTGGYPDTTNLSVTQSIFFSRLDASGLLTQTGTRGQRFISEIGKVVVIAGSNAPLTD